MKKYYIYYFILVALLSWRTLATVVERTKTVSQGTEISKIEQHKSQLAISIEHRYVELANHQAINTQDIDTSSLVAIKTPLVIGTTAVLASR